MSETSASKAKNAEKKGPEKAAPEKKYTPEELKMIDEEIQSSWGEMKESLKRGKIKDDSRNR